MRAVPTVLVALALGARGACAADAPPDSSPWRVHGWIEAWLPAIDGTVGIGELVPTIDITPGVALDLLGDGKYGAGAGGIEAHHAALGLTLFVDSFGVVAKDDDDRPGKSADTPFGELDTGDLDVHQSIAAVEFGVRYRLGQWRLPEDGRSFWLEVLAGGRYLHYHAQVDDDLFKVRFIGIVTENCAEPMLGVRWHLDLLDGLALEMQGDVGGFGAGTDFSWGLDGVLRYRLPWEPGHATIDLMTGYKVFAFRWKYTGGYQVPFGAPNPQSGRIDLTLQGPVLGMVAGF